MNDSYREGTTGMCVCLCACASVYVKNRGEGEVRVYECSRKRMCVSLPRSISFDLFLSRPGRGERKGESGEGSVQVHISGECAWEAETFQ